MTLMVKNHSAIPFLWCSMLQRWGFSRDAHLSWVDIGWTLDMNQFDRGLGFFIRDHSGCVVNVDIGLDRKHFDRGHGDFFSTDVDLTWVDVIWIGINVIEVRVSYYAMN